MKREGKAVFWYTITKKKDVYCNAERKAAHTKSRGTEIFVKK